MDGQEWLPVWLSSVLLGALFLKKTDTYSFYNKDARFLVGPAPTTLMGWILQGTGFSIKPDIFL